MIHIKARPKPPDHTFLMWKLISSAPFDLDLELAVIDGNGVHPLVFPCRRAVGGWINNNKQVEVHPTHWREWHKQMTPQPEPGTAAAT
jgi:hypothetical protein